MSCGRFQCDASHEAIARAFGTATIDVAWSFEEAGRMLRGCDYDVIVSDVLVKGCDVIDFIADSDVCFADRLCVAASACPCYILHALWTLRVCVAFDYAEEGWSRYQHAIQCAVQRTHYWSPSFKLGVERVAPLLAASRETRAVLTPSEQLVLSMIGDGSEDEQAATALGLSAWTVCSVRKSLHRKLRLQNRSELVRYAINLGFVSFMPEGLVRPGLKLLTRCVRHRPSHTPRTVAKTA